MTSQNVNDNRPRFIVKFGSANIFHFQSYLETKKTYPWGSIFRGVAISRPIGLVKLRFFEAENFGFIFCLPAWTEAARVRLFGVICNFPVFLSIVEKTGHELFRFRSTICFFTWASGVEVPFGFC